MDQMLEQQKPPAEEMEQVNREMGFGLMSNLGIFPPQPTQTRLEVELDEEEMMEAEDEFQSFLTQNTSVHIVNDHSVLRALNMPAAPEGYRYDMKKSPPELVRKKEKKVKFNPAPEHFNTTPKAKPSEAQQVDLVSSNYSKAMTTNDTYNVPQRYNWLPKGTKTNNIAPCTNPATYIDLSHLPTFFKTEDEALSTYNQESYQYKMQLKKHGVSRGEGGHVSKFSLVC